MENLAERGSPTASPRGGDDGSGAAAPPPPTEPSAQGAMGTGGSSDQRAVVPPSGSRVIEGDHRKSGKEEEKVEEGRSGGGEVVVTPLDDLNIQWTISTSSSSKEAVGATVGEGGGALAVGDGGEKVPATHPIESSAQSVTTEESRDMRVTMKEVVIVEEIESSEEEAEGVSSERWRVRSRGREDVVMMEWGSREAVGVRGSDGVGDSGDDPRGKRVVTEEPVREQGPLVIYLGDYAIHADLEDVPALGREAPGVLDAVREEVAGGREREMVVLR